MVTIKNSVFLLGLALLGACSPNSNDSPSGKQCGTKESCLSDPNCQCWCSQICNFRNKKNTDRPVYITDDANGKYCYCKQWDYDNYTNNCVDKKNPKVLEPQE